MFGPGSERSTAWPPPQTNMVVSSAPSKIFHLHYFRTINHYLGREMFAIGSISTIIVTTLAQKQQAILLRGRRRRPEP